MNYELFTRIEFLLFIAVTYLCRKDPVLYKLSALFAFIHFLNIFYYPSHMGSLAFVIESFICLVLGIVTIKQSLRAWSLAIGGIMTASICLILFEFIDYAANGSKLTDTWLLWIHITTFLEIAVFAMASNGYLQHYGDDGADTTRGSLREYFGSSRYFGFEHYQTIKKA